MLPTLRTTLRTVSYRNQSLQDIFKSCRESEEVISVEKHTSGIHNTKVTLLLKNGEERVHFYNRINIQDVLDFTDISGGSTQEIIDNLNVLGYDFTTDDLEISNGRLRVPETSLGYYADAPFEPEPEEPSEPPEKALPLIIAGFGTTYPEILSHSPLKVDWGSISRTPEHRELNELYAETVEYINGVPIYKYFAVLDHFSMYGNRARITHADGVSPIDWISLPACSYIEQWYSGGFSSFRCKVPDGTHGLGNMFSLPDYVPPNTTDFSYMFSRGTGTVDIENWDMSNVVNVDYMFSTFNNTIDLSNWSTPKITTTPRGWDQIESEFTFTLPNWGQTVEFIPVEKDRDSMILFLLDVDDGDIAFMAGTELEIDAGDSGWRFELDRNSSIASYAYLAYRDGTLNYSDIRIRPISGEGQIREFGCARVGFIKQWWKDGYAGFNPQLGIMADILPQIEPPNTTNISHLFRHSYVSIANTRFWDMSKFTNFSSIFKYRVIINDDISHWDMQNCENASNMFERTRYSGPSISKWNMGKCRNMNNMLDSVELFADQALVPSGVQDFDEYTHDLSLWCVPLISRAPTGFNNDSVLPQEKCPVWGTCPRGEYVPPVVEPEEPSEDPTDLYVGDWMEITHHLTGSPYITTSSNLEFDMDSEHPFTVRESLGYLDVNFTVLGRMYYIQFVEEVESSEYGVDWPIRFRNSDAGQPICDLNLGASKTIKKWYKDGYTQSSSLRDNQIIPVGMGPYLNAVPPVAPPNTTTLYGFFANCHYFNSTNLQQWDVENVTDLRYFLHNTASFNRDLSYWCVTDITSEPVGFATESGLRASRYPKWGTCPVYVPPPPVVPGDGSWMEFTDINGPFMLYSLGELEIEADDDPGVLIHSESDYLDEEGQVPLHLYAVYLSEFLVSEGENLGPFSNIIRVRPVDGGKMLGISSMYASTIKTWYAAGYESHELLCNPELLGEFTGPAGGQWITNIPATQPTNTTDYRCFFASSAYTGSVDHWDMREATQADYMFYGALGVTGDFSKWCVPLITSAPEGFSDGSSLQPNKLPVWGTCPLG